MFYSADNLYDLFANLQLEMVSRVAIKINLARTPEPNHPRTDIKLLRGLIEYLMSCGIETTIIESAQGYLEENLKSAGLDDLLISDDVSVLDLDYEVVDAVSIGDEVHYIPKCLKNFDLRIALPVTSKRESCIYSNNVKLFVGIVPRKYYQIGEPVRWRPKIHLDLHKSVANIYLALKSYADFDYYINGGNAYHEDLGEFNLSKVYLGSNPIELDNYILKTYFKIEKPDYLKSLEKGVYEI